MVVEAEDASGALVLVSCVLLDPCGVLVACGCVFAIHVVLETILFTLPIARDFLDNVELRSLETPLVVLLNLSVLADVVELAIKMAEVFWGVAADLERPPASKVENRQFSLGQSL